MPDAVGVFSRVADYRAFFQLDQTQRNMHAAVLMAQSSTKAC
jgi:hypothetical protein